MPPGTHETQRPLARPRPQVSADNESFWHGGRDGALMIVRCADCRFWIHPPLPNCPACMSPAVRAEATSGRGTLYSFTINHHEWNPSMPPPYIIGIVDLDEQAGLRVTSNVIDCATDRVSVGMRVEVVFEHRDGIWYPLFRPTEGSGR